MLFRSICRLQIRQHRGLPITVYYSDDMDYKLMHSVQEYFKANSPSACKIDGILSPCEKLKTPEKKWLFDMIRLYGYDNKIRISIENSKPYSFSISLDALYTIIPNGRKAKDRYNKLISFLLTKGITMNIC